MAGLDRPDRFVHHAANWQASEWEHQSHRAGCERRCNRLPVGLSAKTDHGRISIQLSFLDLPAQGFVRDGERARMPEPVSYTHLRAHETVLDLVCRLLLEKKKKTRQ